MLHQNFLKSYSHRTPEQKKTNKLILTGSGICRRGHGTICWQVSLCENAGCHSSGQGGVDGCHFLVESKREIVLSGKKHLCFFFNRRGGVTGHENQLAVPHLPVHTPTLTHTDTHSATLRLNTVDACRINITKMWNARTREVWIKTQTQISNRNKFMTKFWQDTLKVLATPPLTKFHFLIKELSCRLQVHIRRSKGQFEALLHTLAP